LEASRQSLGSTGHQSEFDNVKIHVIFESLWVRKLTGKPAFLTIADSESEAPRIHSTDYEAGFASSSRRKQRFPYPIGLAQFRLS